MPSRLPYLKRANEHHDRAWKLLERALQKLRALSMPVRSGPRIQVRASINEATGCRMRDAIRVRKIAVNPESEA